jgi:hypothetical protein
VQHFVQRGFIAIVGICAIVWGVDVIFVYRTDAPLVDTAQSILSGDRFSTAQLSAMKHQLDVASAIPLPASSLSSTVVMRLLLLEDQLKTGSRPSVSDLTAFQAVVTAALAQSPTNSFNWLVDLWLKQLLGETADGTTQSLLRMSYWSGPNEGWIAVKRNPVALGFFASLPSDLTEQVLSEFAGLVSSGFHAEAANILAGPGWGIRKQLLGRLARIDESDRRWFARVLASKNLDGVSIPGVDERPSRPF